MNCESCIYFQHDTSGLKHGECRRHPPRSHGSPIGTFPWVEPEWWCGEFLPGGDDGEDGGDAETLDKPRFK